jgi:hypothetical protein
MSLRPHQTGRRLRHRTIPAPTSHAAHTWPASAAARKQPERSEVTGETRRPGRTTDATGYDAFKLSAGDYGTVEFTAH